MKKVYVVSLIVYGENKLDIKMRRILFVTSSVIRAAEFAWHYLNDPSVNEVTIIEDISKFDEAEIHEIRGDDKWSIYISPQILED